MRATQLRSDTGEQDTDQQRIRGELSDEQAYSERWKTNADKHGPKDVHRPTSA